MAAVRRLTPTGRGHDGRSRSCGGGVDRARRCRESGRMGDHDHNDVRPVRESRGVEAGSGRSLRAASAAARAVVTNVCNPLSEPYRTGSHLIFDIPTGKPDCFRTAMELQPNPYPASGSHQLNASQLTQRLRKVVSRYQTRDLYLVDLREESHGFIDGGAASWYADNDFGKRRSPQSLRSSATSGLDSKCSKAKHASLRDQGRPVRQPRPAEDDAGQLRHHHGGDCRDGKDFVRRRRDRQVHGSLCTHTGHRPLRAKRRRASRVPRTCDLL